MSGKTGKFTRREAAFIEHMGATGDKIYSAKSAGFLSPASAASVKMQDPAIVAAITARSLERIANEVLPLAVDRHLAILRDQDVSGQTLNRAIEMAYKYGLPASAEGGKKEAHEMTAEELANAIATLERAASDRATPVLELEPGAGVFD